MWKKREKEITQIFFSFLWNNSVNLMVKNTWNLHKIHLKTVQVKKSSEKCLDEIIFLNIILSENCMKKSVFGENFLLSFFVLIFSRTIFFFT